MECAPPPFETVIGPFFNLGLWMEKKVLFYWTNKIKIFTSYTFQKIRTIKCKIRCTTYFFSCQPSRFFGPLLFFKSWIRPCRLYIPLSPYTHQGYPCTHMYIVLLSEADQSGWPQTENIKWFMSCQNMIREHKSGLCKKNSWLLRTVNIMNYHSALFKI